MTRLDLRGRRIVVTGASSGLGAAFARCLVTNHRARVLLVARRAARLGALADQLREVGGEVETMPLDLACDDAVDQLCAAVGDAYGWVLGAAQHHYGSFSDTPEEVIDAMLRVNATAPVRLIRRVLPGLDARGGGGVLVVASTGGLMPAPRQSLYAATKALLVNFTQSLHYERGADARAVVSLCCPGAMLTEMLTESPVMAHVTRRRWMQAMVMPTQAVAEQALAAWVAGQPLFIPGHMNRAMDRIVRLLPRSVAGRGAALVYPDESSP
ncbi:MAG: SDR family NAD(P)-dependent oxidoreductase [Myxococcales bacterium]|nr:SDR family NAD(P)-dependent oxidoreductase [Myxococcales bacterium]